MKVVDIKTKQMATPHLGRHCIFLADDYSGAFVGNFSSIAEGVYIHGATNHAIVNNPKLASTYDFDSQWADDLHPDMPWPASGTAKGSVIIGNDVWIGEDAKILTGVTIGDGAIIGAHAVIAKDVPPYAVVVGNPQQIKRYRYSPEIVEKLLQIKWWLWSDQVIKERMRDMLDVESFVKKWGV